MDNSSDREKLKIQFGIEERVLEALKDQEERWQFRFLGETTKKYDGSRDPHTIELWINSIDGYGDLKDFDGVKKAKLGVTLLTGAAHIWHQNLRLLSKTPQDWVELKAELRAFFKPGNSISVARDRIRNLRQSGPNAQYVQDFMTIKLNIPRMTDEEAVDKFLAGLKDHLARVHIIDYIDMGNPLLNEAI